MYGMHVFEGGFLLGEAGFLRPEFGDITHHVHGRFCSFWRCELQDYRVFLPSGHRRLAAGWGRTLLLALSGRGFLCGKLSAAMVPVEGVERSRDFIGLFDLILD